MLAYYIHGRLRKALLSGNISELNDRDLGSQGSENAVNHLVRQALFVNNNWKDTMSSPLHPFIASVRDWAKKLDEKRGTWDQIDEQIPIARAIYTAFVQKLDASEKCRSKIFSPSQSNVTEESKNKNAHN